MPDEVNDDFISDFMTLTEGAMSPDIFRLWAGISLLAGACERRVWLKTGRRQTFANQYILLVAPPGVGKSVIEEVRELWRAVIDPGSIKSPGLKVAPDSMTKASLLDNLAKSRTTRLPPTGPPIEYHSLLIAAEEFSVLLPAYDLEYIGALNSIWNCWPRYQESRRTGTVKELDIAYPQLHILGGVQPGWLASVFPEEAWSTGLARRTIMVYAPEGQLKSLFDEAEGEVEVRRRIIDKLTTVSALYGEVEFDQAAKVRIEEWHWAGGPPTPGHSKLTHYVRTRSHFMLKLMLVSGVARNPAKPRVELVDFNRALAWLLEAEALMPDIFRAMVGRSDAQVIEELHYFATTSWKMQGGKPLHERLLYGFLSQRVPHEKIRTLLEVSVRAGVLTEGVVPGTYTPRPNYQHGVE